MEDLANKYLGKIIEQKLFDGPGDIPDTLEGLNANDFTAVVYNAVKGIIQNLRESGELKPNQNLDAAGITAQILLETGNGKSSLASKYNNFGGIKATPSWKGKTVMIPNADGNVNWRVYPSVKKGLEEQVRFFLPSKNSRYFKAGVLSAKNAAEHAKRVQDAGYAGEQTDYADRVIKMANSITKKLEKANPQYSKGATYIPETSTSIPEEIIQKPSTSTTNIAAVDEPAINVPISIGKPNPAQVFLNPRTKVDLNTPIKISNPSTKIFDNSFYNDSRTDEQLKQAAASQKFIDSPIKYKKGGTIYPKYFENGGPSDGNPFWYNVLNNVENIVEDHYQSMSPTEYAKLSADTTNKLQQYQDEKIRVENVMDNAHQLGLKLATNAPGEIKKKRGKGYVLNYDSDPYIPTLEPRNVTIGNTQDWEAIGMDFINDPQNYLNNLKDINTYTGEIEYLTNDGENFILDSEGNKVPSYYQGYGCIGAQCGIYSTAGATNISDYKTGYGNQVAKAGDPIFKQLSNKFWDADNQAALAAAGFARVKEGDPIRRGTLARLHDDYYTTKNPSYGHSAMVNKVNADGTQVDFDAKDGFIENPGGLAHGIITSSPYNSYKGRLDYYNYVGNEPQLKKEYETLLEQQKAYKKYNQPVEIPIKKAELTREEPVKMPFIEKKQYPNTRRGRKQEQQHNAYITAYMDRMQKK